MRLGILAGGFKPFHTGHFAKLALALEENDAVLLAYGLGPRSRGSDLDYDAAMASEIYGIVRRALHREFGSKLRIVEGRPNPVSVAFDAIEQVLTSNDTNVVLYSDPEDGTKFVEYIQRKFPSAVQDGRFSLRTGLDESGKSFPLVAALRAHAHGITDGEILRLVSVRGSDVRRMAASGDSRGVLACLAPVLRAGESGRILELLGCPTPGKQHVVSPDAHILNLYEDVNITIDELRCAMRAILGGHVRDVQEKLDGQNITFTFRGGSIETFTKGVGWTGVCRGGRKMLNYDRDYADRPALRDSLKLVHSSLQAAAESHPELTARLFGEGSIVVEASMISPSCPNLVPYESSCLALIGFRPVNPSVGPNELPRLESAYERWLRAATTANTAVRIAEAPSLELGMHSDADAVAVDLESALSRVMELSGNDPNDGKLTVGQVVQGLVARQLQLVGMQHHEAFRAAARIALGQRAENPIRKFTDPELVKRLESTSCLLDVARFPLERVFHRLARAVFRELRFELAPNDLAAGEGIRDFVREVRSSDVVACDERQRESIRSALSRIENESDFEKAVEGIVFSWQGRTYKLTGLFTPINKLHGFFKYGPTPAQFA